VVIVLPLDQSGSRMDDVWELINLTLFKDISKVFVLLEEFDRFWFRLG
jgi:hypothetical protein